MIELIGLTNAITDIIINVTDKELSELGLKKGFRNKTKEISYNHFFEIVKGKSFKAFQGGSPANVIYGATYLGIKTALFGVVGDDEYGHIYLESLINRNIKSFFNLIKGKSGLCYILVTPDGEKSSIPAMGVAGNYDFDLNKLTNAKFFHTSGYELLTNPERTEEMIDYAKKIGTKTSFDLSDPYVIKKQRRNIEDIIRNIDVLFMTIDEAYELTGYQQNDALNELSKVCKIIAMKKGKKGSTVREGDREYEIPIYKTKVINTNGAGDAYAAGFLASYIKGLNIEICGCDGSYLASKVCGIEEPHI